MKKLAVALVLILSAASLAAQGLSGEAVFSWEEYDLGAVLQSGFRQSYRLNLDRALGDSSRFRLFFRGDDFTDTSKTTGRPAVDRRQLEPGVELLFNLGNLRMHGRSELFLTESSGDDSSSTLDRTTANLTWTPPGLPEVRILGLRNVTDSEAIRGAVVDESIMGTFSYFRSGLLVSAMERISSFEDGSAGFSRSSRMHSAEASYAGSLADGRYSFTVTGSAQRFDHLERALDGGSGIAVPTPVAVSRVLYAVDETPLDSSDHPPQPVSGLDDSLDDVLTAILIGPGAPSFQNIVLDLGRLDRIDEVRVVIRDLRGNPVATGGGAVVWDAYSSQDGVTWVPLASTSQFDQSRSLYSILFDSLVTRWLKVVNFGVTTEPASITEVEAYVHDSLDDGRRDMTQELVSTSVAATASPFSRLNFFYMGSFSSTESERDDGDGLSSKGADHDITATLQVLPTVAIRGQLTSRDYEYGTISDFSDRSSAFLDWRPTSKLTATVEHSLQTQTLDGDSFDISTHALHARATFFRSLVVSLGGGVQSQSENGIALAERRYATLSGNAQLTRSLRLLLSGSIQEVTEFEDDPSVVFLGARQDNRVAADLLWRPGEPLVLGVRLGWTEGAERSGLTQRYRIEWFPFAEGTISLAAIWDEDIDPIFNRTSRRAVLNPRWFINRSASLDVNYTFNSHTSDFRDQEQQTLAALLTLRR